MLDCASIAVEQDSRETWRHGFLQGRGSIMHNVAPLILLLPWHAYATGWILCPGQEDCMSFGATGLSKQGTHALDHARTGIHRECNTAGECALHTAAFGLHWED